MGQKLTRAAEMTTGSRRIAAPAWIQLRGRGQRFETLPEPVIRFFSSGSPR